LPPSSTSSVAARIPRVTVPGAGRLASPLGIGLAVMYMSVIVLIPFAALLNGAFENGWDSFWRAITNPQAMAALKLTVGVSLVVVAINVVMGTLIAWVLVRDSFPGKSLVNSLIDLPFALPTIVAGVVLLSLYGPSSPIGLNLAFTKAGICLALLVVTLPFVVRSVQPVLLELDTEMEQAARYPAGGVPQAIARGLARYARGDRAGAIAVLAPLLPELERVGAASRAQHDMLEYLQARHRQRLRRLDLALRYRVDAGADDLGTVGAQVDGHCNAGRLPLAQLQPEAGQTEKYEKQLHQKRRVADQFHVAGINSGKHRQGPRPRNCTKNAHTKPQNGADQGQVQRSQNTLHKVFTVFPDAAEVEGVSHFFVPGLQECADRTLDLHPFFGNAIQTAVLF